MFRLFALIAAIGALVIGAIVFGDSLALHAILGAVLVIGSGLYVFWREAVLARR